MDKPAHTPGPWHRNIAPASKYPVIFAGRNTHVALTLTQGLPVEQQEANANLIAAAPVLLAAAQEMLRVETSQGISDRVFDAALDTLTTAIRRAHGDYS
jgi:hypothetical protein